MNRTAHDILDLYIKGKDQGKYLLLEDIYSEEAMVLFEIASDSISFPEKISGNKEIARVLSKDFSHRFREVRTYYLSQPASDTEDILQQHWLVAMQDSNSGETRVGAGYYNWKFSATCTPLKIAEHKIYIHDMISIADDRMSELKRIQGNLNYPWAQKQDVLETLKSNVALAEIWDFLK